MDERQLTFLEMPKPEPRPRSRGRRGDLPELADVRLEDLPENLRDIADVIGLRPTLALVRWRGGTQLPVPRRPKPDHPLTLAIGPAAASHLCRHYAGERVSLPSLRTVLLPARGRAVRRDYDAGARVPELVARYSVSERQVRKMLNSPD